MPGRVDGAHRIVLTRDDVVEALDRASLFFGQPFEPVGQRVHVVGGRLTRSPRAAEPLLQGGDVFHRSPAQTAQLFDASRERFDVATTFVLIGLKLL